MWKNTVFKLFVYLTIFKITYTLVLCGNIQRLYCCKLEQIKKHSVANNRAVYRLVHTKL